MELERHDDSVVRFDDDTSCPIHGKGFITIDGKNNTDIILYVEGLKHNLLSVRQVVDKGYVVQFKNDICKILGSLGDKIAIGTKSKGNILKRMKWYYNWRLLLSSGIVIEFQ